MDGLFDEGLYKSFFQKKESNFKVQDCFFAGSIMSKCLFITFLLTAGCRCFAQSFNENNFTHYTKLDGLSHNYITGIVQDSTGYIWIATNKGLSRFDGK